MTAATTDPTDAGITTKHLTEDLAKALAGAVEYIDRLTEGTPAGKDWRALAKGLRKLRGPLYDALLSLEEIEPYMVCKTLAEYESPLLCLCGR
jgi:hypothetical protein